jgi:hypothetical protein
MKTAYWIIAVAGACFVGWADDHTDETPIILGFVLIFGAVLGSLAPRRFLLSWAIAGAPVFIVEVLVFYRVISAPWPSAPGSPFVALAAYVPALIGVAVGAGLRRATGTMAIS